MGKTGKPGEESNVFRSLARMQAASFLEPGDIARVYKDSDYDIDETDEGGGIPISGTTYFANKRGGGVAVEINQVVPMSLTEDDYTSPSGARYLATGTYDTDIAGNPDSSVSIVASEDNGNTYTVTGTVSSACRGNNGTYWVANGNGRRAYQYDSNWQPTGVEINSTGNSTRKVVGITQDDIGLLVMHSDTSFIEVFWFHPDTGIYLGISDTWAVTGSDKPIEDVTFDGNKYWLGDDADNLITCDVEGNILQTHRNLGTIIRGLDFFDNAIWTTTHRLQKTLLDGSFGGIDTRSYYQGPLVISHDGTKTFTMTGVNVREQDNTLAVGEPLEIYTNSIRNYKRVK